MTRILAIDPGPVESAHVVYDTETRDVLAHAKFDNETLRQSVTTDFHCGLLVVEMVASYGMPVGKEIFETVLWTGIFLEAWRKDRCRFGTDRLLYRRDVKLHICGSARAKDANVRQAIIDRYGGKEAVGTKKTPGPLYGVKGDVWQALAVAITAAETEGIDNA